MRIPDGSIFKARTPEYRIEAKATETTFYIYDEIGWYGISAEQLVKDINAVKGGTIVLRINSPGGGVFDGMAIFNAIKQHPAKTVAYIDGLAASICSIIPLACDQVIMADNAFMMIHEPWGLVIGSADEMRNEADLLDKLSGALVKTYMNESGKDEKDIKAMMKAETWFDAAEALEIGFADKIYDADTESEPEAALFDLSVFNNVPDKLVTKQDGLNPRDLERALRDAGCSRSEAKEIMAKGFTKQEARDAQPVPKPHLRDADDPTEPPAKKDSVNDLLIRAEAIAPS